MTRDEFLALRSNFAPKLIKLVIVAKSPPYSGLYFYKLDGKVTEPLFAAMMKQINCNPTTKEEGLREFQHRGWVLVDTTYEPVNDPGRKKKDRDAVILRDYPLLLADLEKMLPDKSMPIILMKKNVCRLLERKLTDDGFNVLNKGRAVSFPSHSWQSDFDWQFSAILQSAETITDGTAFSRIKAFGNYVLPALKWFTSEVLPDILEEAFKKRNKMAGQSYEYATAYGEYVTAPEIAHEYWLDPKDYRAALRVCNFPWHQHNEPWTVRRDSAEHHDMLEVAQRMSVRG